MRLAQGLSSGTVAGSCPQCGSFTIAGVCDACFTAQRGMMATAEPTHVVFVNRSRQGGPPALEQVEWQPGLVASLLTVARARGWLDGPNRHVFFLTNQLNPRHEGHGRWTMPPQPGATVAEAEGADPATESEESDGDEWVDGACW